MNVNKLIELLPGTRYVRTVQVLVDYLTVLYQVHVRVLESLTPIKQARQVVCLYASELLEIYLTLCLFCSISYPVHVVWNNIVNIGKCITKNSTNAQLINFE